MARYRLSTLAHDTEPDMRLKLSISALVSLLLTALTPAAQCLAQSSAPSAPYPSKAIRFVVPYAAGGGTDAMARYLARGMEQRLGVPIVIENKAGSGTLLGGAFVSKSAPDGYTLLMATSSTLAIAPNLTKTPPFDPVAGFTPLSMIAAVPFVLLVHPSLGVDTMAEFIALARSRKGDLSYATGGNGSAHHIFMELFRSMTGLDLKHVPYRGGGPAQIDVIAGHVPIMFGDVGPAEPLIRGGQLKGLGVTTMTRVATLPEIPTLHEAGLTGYEANSWQCVVGPPGMTAEIVSKINNVLVDVMADPETQTHFIGIGAQPGSSTPAGNAAFIKSEFARWAKVIERMGPIKD
jgi:tripartite-type tricarboxylate transporter receptor subunit TctC